MGTIHHSSLHAAIGVVVALLLALAGCSKSNRTTPKPPENKQEKPWVTHKLKALGVQVRAPGSWELKKLNPSSYHLSGPAEERQGSFVSKPSISIIHQSESPRLLIEATATCTRYRNAKVTDKGKLQDGGFFFSCDRLVQDKTFRTYTRILPTGDGAVHCSGGTLGRLDSIKTICQSISRL